MLDRSWRIKQGSSGWASCLGLLAGLLSSACGAPAESAPAEKAELEPTAESTEPLALHPCFSKYDIPYGGVRLEEGTLSFCYLTYIAGNFQYAPVEAKVYQGTDGYWRANKSGGVVHGEVELFASATCIKQACLKGDGVNDVYPHWISGPITARANSQQKFPLGCTCENQRVNAWQADSATVLNSFPFGTTAGGAEYVRINQATRNPAATTVTANDCQCDTRFAPAGVPQHAITGTAHSIFVGTPGGADGARFIGPTGNGRIDLAGTYSVHTKGTKVVNMASVNDAMCYFTALGGKFRGGAEQAEIRLVTDPARGQIWQLRVSQGSAADDDGLFASANCYKRYQLL